MLQLAPRDTLLAVDVMYKQVLWVMNASHSRVCMTRALEGLSRKHVSVKEKWFSEASGL